MRGHDITSKRIKFMKVEMNLEASRYLLKRTMQEKKLYNECSIQKGKVEDVQIQRNSVGKNRNKIDRKLF